jgi:acetolactate synthase regulatory subunit
MLSRTDMPTAPAAAHAGHARNADAPVRDRAAADPALPDQANPGQTLLDHYVISADADPGLMPRVLQLIAKRGLVPAECHAFTRRANEPGGPARLTMEVKVAGLERMPADHVAACLRQLFGVDSVLHLAHRQIGG